MSASYHLIRFEGALDISRYPEIRKAFEEAPASVPTLVDLTDADSVDSIFLSELLMARRRSDAPFAVLIAPASQLSRLFDIAGLGPKVNVHTDLTKAVEALGLGQEADRLTTD